jgi:glycosyltransferase involved in cell wall biosynthesis
MPDAEPFVTVYTITYNQREAVGRTVSDLLAQEYPRERYEVVVLDDGSGDGTAAALAQLAATAPVPVKVIACAHEADYQSARRWNQCIAAASSQAEVFVQVDDVCVRPDFLRRHTAWHAGPGPVMVTGAKFEGDEETWELASCRRGGLSPGGTAAEGVPFTAMWGASLGFSRAAMEAVMRPPHERPYDERMEGWGFHEVELALRMERAGAKLVYDPAVGVFHRNHQPRAEAGRGLKRDELVERGGRKNEEYLLRKHGLARLPRW